MDVTALVAVTEETQPEIEYVDTEDPEVRLGWRIKDLPSLEWALARAGECEAEKNEVEASAAAMKARIDKRAAQLKEKAERGVGFFTARILEFMEAHRAELVKGKAKSRALVSGTVGWRKAGGRLKVTDKAALQAWAETDESLCRVKLEPDMKAIQKLAAETFTVPPGTEWIDEHDEPYVSPIVPESSLIVKEEP